MMKDEYAQEFVRKLTKPLERSLITLFSDKNSWLYQWFEATDDQKPFLAIRKNYASIYVKGCAFTLESGEAKLSFDANYLNSNRFEKLRTELSGYLTPDRKRYVIPSRTLNEYPWCPQIVCAALDYINHEKKSTDKERPLVTEALLQYGRSLDCEIAFTENMVTQVAAPIVKDLESNGARVPYCLERKDGKDKWTIKKPDALLLEKRDSKLILRFFEAKDGGNDNEWNGKAARPSVLDQVWFYDKLLERYEERLIEQYKYVVRLFGHLGCGNHPRFVQFKEFNDDPQALNGLQLDPNHDVVLLGANLSHDDERVRRLSKRLIELRGDAQRRRVHLSTNASDWIT